MLTKDDLNAIENIFDKKLDEKLKPINKKINRIQRTLNETISFFDKQILSLEKKS